jgi:hypothetical protein
MAGTGTKDSPYPSLPSAGDDHGFFLTWLPHPQGYGNDEDPGWPSLSSPGLVLSSSIPLDGSSVERFFYARLKHTG